jgi:hypothetical protein
MLRSRKKGELISTADARDFRIRPVFAFPAALGTSQKRTSSTARISLKRMILVVVIEPDSEVGNAAP